MAKVLSRLGIKTVEDLLYYFPREYEDRSQVTPIKQLKVGLESALIKGEIIKIEHQQTRNRFSILKLTLADPTGQIRVIFFNQPFLLKLFRRGMKLIVSGKIEVNLYEGGLQLLVRDFEILTGEPTRIVPLYHLTEKLFPKYLRNIMKQAWDKYSPLLQDKLSARIRSKYKLMDLKGALAALHFPDDLKFIAPARYRIIFEDFFIFELGLLQRKEEIKEETGIAFKIPEKRLAEFIGDLPYTLTSAQKRVLEEIKEDMRSASPMNRLLQGEVGSGKTIIAALAALIAMHNGYQAAIMAPTEILAQQHYDKISKMLTGFNLKLLTGTTQKKERTQSIDKADLIIGTHALIEEKVKFEKLGLTIIDEQHRFGVMQRAQLAQKGYHPDVLFMTATPIPRSLTLVLYGDLDRSVIDEMPPGRVPVKTYYVSAKKRAGSYEFIRGKIKEGRQVFLVCPLVEESEELDLKAAKLEADRLQKEIFPEFKVGLIHGRMKGEQKDRIMTQFMEGKIDLLVSTTVIEVGIDVPNASVMVVEHAERFGLSQLHQLRGRIGRGSAESFCLLMADPKTEEAKIRLKAMLDLSDGFKIAEVDLKLRGPGEVFGVRQAGIPEFRLGDIVRDEKVLRVAREAAENYIKEDPQGARDLWDSQRKDIKSS